MGFRPRPPEEHIDSTLVTFRHGVQVGNFDGWVKDLDNFLEGNIIIAIPLVLLWHHAKDLDNFLEVNTNAAFMISLGD